MERNTKTIAGKLQPGDRFYKANDKKKIVWEVREMGAMVTIGDANISRLSYPEKIRTETEVIFLRHNKIEA